MRSGARPHATPGANNMAPSVRGFEHQFVSVNIRSVRYGREAAEALRATIAAIKGDKPLSKPLMRRHSGRPDRTNRHLVTPV
jgi:hypothetical protein